MGIAIHILDVAFVLMPFLQFDDVDSWRDEIHTQCNGVELYFTQRSVMTKAHKYVFNGFDSSGLTFKGGGG